MNTENRKEKYNQDEILNTEVIIRYSTFYKFFIISILFFLFAAFLFLRYADFKYESNARI